MRNTEALNWYVALFYLCSSACLIRFYCQFPSAPAIALVQAFWVNVTCHLVLRLNRFCSAHCPRLSSQSTLCVSHFFCIYRAYLTSRSWPLLPFGDSFFARLLGLHSHSSWSLTLRQLLPSFFLAGSLYSSQPVVLECPKALKLAIPTSLSTLSP